MNAKKFLESMQAKYPAAERFINSVRLAVNEDARLDSHQQFEVEELFQLNNIRLHPLQVATYINSCHD
jgi:hypothetical protein